jgi:hypothetical protein
MAEVRAVRDAEAAGVHLAGAKFGLHLRRSGVHVRNIA